MQAGTVVTRDKISCAHGRSKKFIQSGADPLSPIKPVKSGNRRQKNYVVFKFIFKFERGEFVRVITVKYPPPACEDHVHVNVHVGELKVTNW